MSTQHAPRALGLVRVSKERAGMVSPEIQRAAITDYAAARGYDLTRWIEGLDESGSRARSGWWRRLDDAVGMLEAGQVEVLVVWKYSRAARHRLRWAVALDRVEVAGGRLESATEQLDTSTSAGRFARGMLAELQAFEAERIGEVWREVHARRVASGRPANGKPRYGYRYDTAAKVHVPDPTAGPVLAELYARYLAGESVHALVRWMNANGWPTLTGGPWSDRTLRRVLDSGFGAGWFAVQGELHRGVHEPVVDAETWEAYLDARGVRRTQPARVERSTYLLSGLVRCGLCGGSMTGGRFGRTQVVKYRCRAAKEHGPGTCPARLADGAAVEGEVLAWLRTRPELLTEPLARLRAAWTSPAADVEQLRARAASAEAALARLLVQEALQPLPGEVYAAARATLTLTLEDAQRALGEALAAEESTGGTQRRRPTFDDAQGLLAGWDAVPVAQRREVLRQVLAGVVVTTRPELGVNVEPIG